MTSASASKSMHSSPPLTAPPISASPAGLLPPNHFLASASAGRRS